MSTSRCAPSLWANRGAEGGKHHVSLYVGLGISPTAAAAADESRASSLWGHAGR